MKLPYEGWLAVVATIWVAGNLVFWPLLASSQATQQVPYSTLNDIPRGAFFKRKVVDTYDDFGRRYLLQDAVVWSLITGVSNDPENTMVCIDGGWYSLADVSKLMIYTRDPYRHPDSVVVYQCLVPAIERDE